jgi:hypothetical protein
MYWTRFSWIVRLRRSSICWRDSFLPRVTALEAFKARRFPAMLPGLLRRFTPNAVRHLPMIVGETPHQ